jgi:DNA-binding transcriptional regulator PaaX
VRKAISSLGGKGTSSEIRAKLKDEFGISASAAELRPALQALVEEGELGKSGEARAKTYSMKKKK